jgi:NAD(P)-dependent dehydrogenase (short-subunit alcohol dehydrogenase family)
MDDLDLLVVSGASRGIGNKIALDLASLAKTVLAIGSSQAIANEKFSKNTIQLQLDLENFQNVGHAVTDIIDLHSTLKIGVVLCASQIGAHGGIFESNLEDWNRLFKINVLGNIALLKAIIDHMPSNALIRVAFFAGGGAAYGYPEFSGYALSKVATVRAVENIGLEFEQKGINGSIIAVAPGAVDTEMLATVVSYGGVIKTKTDISEPVSFVRRFLLDQVPSSALNGRFIHVRDDVDQILDVIRDKTDLFKLRRIQ